MADFLKAVENQDDGFIKTRNLVKNDVGSTVFTLNDDEVKFTLAQRTDITSREFGNLFSTFNLPITDEQKALYQPGGIFSNTGFENFNVDSVIVVNIPKNLYGELILGNSIQFTVPVYDNALSANTQYTIRSVYYDPGADNIVGAPRTERLQSYDNPLRLDSVQGNGFASERISTSYIHASTNKSSADTNSESNVVYLFSDNIAPPISGTSWLSGTSYSSANPRDLAILRGPFRDVPVGIAYLDKGFFVITHPTIVNNFPWSAGTTSTTSTDLFTDIFFTGSPFNISATYRSFVTEFVQTIVCTALPNEFFTTTNPTYTAEMLSNNDPVYITEIGLYNENLELIAIAKPSQPIPKTRTSFFSFTIQIKV